MTKQELNSDDQCFACGSLNAQGLRLQFSYTRDGMGAQTTFIPDARYQGWQGIVHGGIIITVLDEAMAKAAYNRGYRVVTGEIMAKLKSPARVLEPLQCESVIKAVKKKIIYATATARRQGGAVVAEAAAKLFIVSGDEQAS